MLVSFLILWPLLHWPACCGIQPLLFCFQPLEGKNWAACSDSICGSVRADNLSFLLRGTPNEFIGPLLSTVASAFWGFCETCNKTLWSSNFQHQPVLLGKSWCFHSHWRRLRCLHFSFRLQIKKRWNDFKRFFISNVYNGHTELEHLPSSWCHCQVQGWLQYLPHLVDQHLEAMSFPSLFCHLPFLQHSCRHLFPAKPVFQTAAVSNLTVAVPDILLFCRLLVVTLILLLWLINAVLHFIPSSEGLLVLML